MSNITENKLNTTILPADLVIINNGIAAAAGKIPVGTLTEEQRGSLLGMDVENKVFVEDALNEIGISGTGIIPPFISGQFIQNDITLFEQMDVIEGNLMNLVQHVRDVKRICADEAMTAALAIYKLYEMANLAGVPGGKQGYERLRARFVQSIANPTVPTP